MPTATVDVLIPTRGSSQTLQRALDSVDLVRAAEPDFEITAHVVEDTDALGPAETRNRAAAQGSAEFIALLDDDDRWIAPRLGRAVDILRKRERIVIVSGDAELASGGRFLTQTPPTGGEGRDHGALALDCSICTSTVTLRRADWEAAGGMDASFRHAEDYEFWLRLTRDGRRAHVLPVPLAWRDDAPPSQGDDRLAMTESTLRALAQSAAMPEGHAVLGERVRHTEGVRTWHDRRGRLRGVYAHGLAKQGDFSGALEQSLLAVQEAPTARVAWTSLIRAGLRLRRPA